MNPPDTFSAEFNAGSGRLLTGLLWGSGGGDWEGAFVGKVRY